MIRYVFINTAGGHHTINGYIIIAKEESNDDNHEKQLQKL